MKELYDAITHWGTGISPNIVKVDMFLNHRIDTALMFKMGQAIADYFASRQPTVVLTVEASGIALALTTAHALGDIPVLYAKKSATVVQSGECVQAKVYSFTHKTENYIRIEKRYLPSDANVLIVDDFLADGQAAHGMMELCRQTGCKVCGVGVAVEKGFQPGGKALRDAGVDVLSLAIVQKVENGTISLVPDCSNK